MHNMNLNYRTQNIVYATWWCSSMVLYLASEYFDAPDWIERSIDCTIRYIPFIFNYYNDSIFPSYTKGLLLINILFIIVSIITAYKRKRFSKKNLGTKLQQRTDYFAIRFVIFLYLFVFITIGSIDVISIKLSEHWFGKTIFNLSKNKFTQTLLYTFSCVSFSLVVSIFIYLKFQLKNRE